MKHNILRNLVCPKTGSVLTLQNEVTNEAGEIVSGFLVNANHDKYEIIDGIPSLLVYSENSEKNQYAMHLFKEKAAEYDKYQHLSFETFWQDETQVRNSMIDRLNLMPDNTVLELNAGTGSDSLLISKRLSKEANFHVQDISADMLNILKEKMKKSDVSLHITQSNACYLPYPDHMFDAIYSFAGVGMSVYADNKKILAEIIRVAKVGAKVVIGGLSLAPWLRTTTFAKILLNHNSHYANEIDLTHFPIEARNLNLSWILSGAGFVLDFTVGQGEPEANFDYEIPGVRGGTHKTRFYGQLEGVTPETKELALKAREKLGLSMHQWLDSIIKNEAKKVLEK